MGFQTFHQDCICIICIYDEQKLNGLQSMYDNSTARSFAPNPSTSSWTIDGFGHDSKNDHTRRRWTIEIHHGHQTQKWFTTWNTTDCLFRFIKKATTSCHFQCDERGRTFIRDSGKQPEWTEASSEEEPVQDKQFDPLIQT